MSAVKRPRLALTLGDPRGVGPEIVVAALAATAGEVEPLLVGPAGTAADGAAPLLEVGRWRGAAAGGTQTGEAEREEIDAGRLAGAAIEQAAALALKGEVAGIVTAPIDKHALHAAGYGYPGHTEMLAALAGVTRVGMLMVAERTALGGPLRVLLATTHIPLSAVPTAVTTPLLIEQAMLLRDALVRDWGERSPRLALCALNPHASDGGLFGDEEARVLSPAVDALRAEGVAVAGPLPADTVFLRAARGEFDAVVAPYHDVGMAAFKTAAFGRGVNVTLGLPFVRTSPDHGTARDIAGRALADPSSMIEALRLAARLARARAGSARGTAASE